MKIESRVPEIIRELPSGRRTDYISDRPGSFTSEPIGSSTGNSGKTAPEIAGERYGSSANLSPQSRDIGNAVEKLNELVQSQQTNVSFSVDKAADATVIKVFKTETGELIKQFPPEEILAMKAKISQTIGLLYDAKV